MITEEGSQKNHHSNPSVQLQHLNRAEVLQYNRLPLLQPDRVTHLYIRRAVSSDRQSATSTSVHPVQRPASIDSRTQDGVLSAPIRVEQQLATWTQLAKTVVSSGVGCRSRSTHSSQFDEHTRLNQRLRQYTADPVHEAITCHC